MPQLGRRGGVGVLIYARTDGRTENIKASGVEVDYSRGRDTSEVVFNWVDYAR